MCADSRSTDSCFFPPPSLRGFVWTRAMQLFTALVGNHHHGFYLSSPALLICGCKRKRQREGPGRERKKNGLWPEDESPLSALPPSPLSFSACLGCLPFSFALITAFVKKKKEGEKKLCQRAEIVLMRGLAAFASVIWWISLGTHKTRRTRGLAATSKPPGVAVCYY